MGQPQMRNFFDKSKLLWVLAAGLIPQVASAHEAAGMQFGSFIGGLAHPVLGVDHFLAMVSVGILSAQMGGRAIWTVPATFIGVMSFGGGVGMIDIGLSAIELGIACSLLALGVAIAMDRKIPLSAALAAVGFFAIFHGYAHGAEIPNVAKPLIYSIGFLTGTAVLHLFGVIIGDIAQRYVRGKLLLRISGGAIAGIGTAFLVGIA